MAQIKKYQSGGNTPKKYGALTIDGIKYDGTEDLINQLYTYGNSLRSDVSHQFGKIIDSIKTGNDVEIDSSGDGSIRGVNFDVSNKQSDRLSRRRRRVGSFLGSVNHGREQDAREAIYAAKDFKYIAPEETKNKYDWSNKLEAEYKRDKDNKFELANNNKIFIQGANNLRIINRLRNIKNIPNYTDRDIFKGYNKLEKQAYINFYNRIGDDGIEALIKRIEDGTWNEDDRLALDDIGIFLGTEPTSEEITQRARTTGQPSGQESVYLGAGLPTDNSSLLGLSLTRNTDGTYSLGEGIDGNAIFGARRRYINDNFLHTHNEYSPLRGWFWWDGKLIPRSIAEDDNSAFYKNLNNWIYNNKSDNFGTNDVAVWGEDTDPFTTYDSSLGFIPGLQDNGNRMRVRTLRNPNDPVNIIYEYYDRNSERDRYGFIKPESIRRIQYNTITGEVAELAPISGIDVNYENIENNFQPYSNRAYGYYEIPISDGTNSTTIFRNPYDANDVWYHKEGMNQPYKLAPEEVQQLISEGLLQANPQIFGGRGTISRQQDEAFSSNRPNYQGQTELGRFLDQATGFGIANSLIRRLYTTKTPEVNGEPWNRTPKNIFTYQSGGRINYGEKTVQSSDTSVKANKVNDSSKAKSTDELSDLTKADKMQIASIAGDIASLVAAIPTGGNPVAGTLGYASSLAQFGSDVSRDGFQWGDLVGLFTNLGLDTVSLFPGIGGVSKLAKVGRAVKTSARLLKRVLLTAGASNAVSALNNIVDGKGTLDDWKTLSTGLFAIKGIKNEVQNVRALQYKGKVDTPSPKTKEDFKREYVDKVVAEKNLGKLNGNPTEWANPDGTIKDYDKAIEALTKSGNLKISKAMEAKWRASATGSKVKAKTTNLFSNSYNPFNSNYRWDIRNRKLPEDFNIESLAGNTSKLRTYGRLARKNPEIFKAMQEEGQTSLPQFNFSSPYVGNFIYRAPIFKRGGKIIKAQGGISTYWLDSNGKRKVFQAAPVEVLGSKPSYLAKPNFNMNLISPTLTDLVHDQSSADRRKSEVLSNLTSNNEQVDITKPLGEWAYGSKPKSFNINPDMLYGFADFVISQNAINKGNRKMKDAILNGMIGSQVSMPTELYSKFSDYGLRRMYNDNIRESRIFKRTTSDPIQALAENTMKSASIAKIKNERDTKYAQLLSQHTDKVLAQKQQYAAQRDQIAATNRNNWYKGLAQLDMQDANKAAQDAQNIKSLLYQFRQDNAKDLQERLAIKDKLLEINANTDYTNKLKQLFESKGGFDALTDEEKEQFDNNWVKATEYKYLDEALNIKKQSLFDAYITQANDPERRHSWFNLLGKLDIPVLSSIKTPKASKILTSIFKKGGTITRYRDVGEQAYLDQQKAINKAVNDLNNNIIKLFIKMMS